MATVKNMAWAMMIGTVLSMAGGSAFGQTFALNGTNSQDAFTDSADPTDSNNNANAGNTIQVGSNNNGAGRDTQGWIQVTDFTGMPAVASSVTLSLYRWGGGAPDATMQVREVLGSWIEGGAGHITHSTRPAVNPVAISSTPIQNNDNYDGNQPGDTVFIGRQDFDITALYNAWRAAPATNFGVNLYMPYPGGADEQNSYRPSEFGDDLPQLIIVAGTPVPEPTTLGLAGVAGLGLLARRRRTA